MVEPWLHVVGIGEDGLDGLTPVTRAVVEAAEVIVGGDRHHDLSGTVAAERIAWPSPFDAMIDVIHAIAEAIRMRVSVPTNSSVVIA